MHGTPLDIGQGGSPVDDIAKHIEHTRQNFLAHWRLQRPPGVFHRHAARETLRGRQRDPPHMARIQLREHFDDDAPFPSRPQNRMDRRQMLVEAHVHDTAAHRGDRPQVRNNSGFLSEHIHPFGTVGAGRGMAPA